MPAIATMARQAQPGLLIVDRTVHGPYENYQTPEQRVPDQQLPHPWESCITLGTSWGYVQHEKLKPANKVIHQLVEVVAKGGSLLLGVGPTPEGTLPEPVVQRLSEIGNWLKVNGAAIYNTRPTTHYKDNNIYFTQSKDSSTLYAMVLIADGVPGTIEWSGHIPGKGSRIKLLATGSSVKFVTKGNKVIVTLPSALQKRLASEPALAFSIKK
jgi:alpha-L-fucosidase